MGAPDPRNAALWGGSGVFVYIEPPRALPGQGGLLAPAKPQRGCVGEPLSTYGAADLAPIGPSKGQIGADGN